MKKLLLALCCMAIVSLLSAQYCGNSGPGVCTPSGTFALPGLYPSPDSLAPLINGVNAATLIQFENFDTVPFNGTSTCVEWLQIDSIVGLPAGVCWASDTSSNTFLNQEQGC